MNWRTLQAGTDFIKSVLARLQNMIVSGRIILVFIVMMTIIGLHNPVTAQSIDPNPDLTLLWSQVQRQPDDFAVACVPLNNRTNAVYHNIDTSFPLVSVGKLMIFIAYAERLDQGEISLGETITVDALNRFHLERTDGNAHDRFMQTYPEETQVISLWEVAADGMLQYSSNAASDYLLQRLGIVDWDALYAQFGLTGTSHPHPLNMIPIMMGNHETGIPSREIIQSPSLFADGKVLYSRFLSDAQWREDELAYRFSRRRGFPRWDLQTMVLEEHTMTGTVRDFIKVMAVIYGDSEILNSSVKGLVRYALQWRYNADVNNSYIEYGSKLGYYSGGTQTLITYGQLREGEPVISVIFFKAIPQRTFYTLLREESIQNLSHWLNFNACDGLIKDHLLSS